VDWAFITASTAWMLAAKTLRLDNDNGMFFKLRPFHHFHFQVNSIVYLVLPGDYAFVRLGELT
jgi:hypothetical protein